MTDEAPVNFEALRAKRDAAIEQVFRETVERLGGDPETAVFHCREFRSACYCDCGSGGPCEHQFEGWRDFEDGRGGEQFCQRCGEGAMSHSMRFLP